LKSSNELSPEEIKELVDAASDKNGARALHAEMNRLREQLADYAAQQKTQHDNDRKQQLMDSAQNRKDSLLIGIIGGVVSSVISTAIIQIIQWLLHGT